MELDALFHLPGWQEEDDEVFRRKVEAAIEGEGWVVDGSYGGKLGDLVLSRADTGNRQTWRFAFFMRDSLVSYAIKSHFRRQRLWPEVFARQPDLQVVRLRSPREVSRWLAAQ